MKPTSTECQKNREDERLKNFVLRTGRSNPASDKSSCSGDPASGDVTSSNDPCSISVAQEDTQILHIPFPETERNFFQEFTNP